jgi:hypothetical protein
MNRMQAIEGIHPESNPCEGDEDDLEEEDDADDDDKDDIARDVAKDVQLWIVVMVLHCEFYGS